MLEKVGRWMRNTQFDGKCSTSWTCYCRLRELAWPAVRFNLSKLEVFSSGSLCTPYCTRIRAAALCHFIWYFVLVFASKNDLLLSLFDDIRIQSRCIVCKHWKYPDTKWSVFLDRWAVDFHCMYEYLFFFKKKAWKRVVLLGARKLLFVHIIL